MSAMDEKWVEGLKRLAAANARANRERLQGMTLRESLERFEEHCRCMHRQFDVTDVHRTHPVGLIRYWKRA